MDIVKIIFSIGLFVVNISVVLLHQRFGRPQHFVNPGIIHSLDTRESNVIACLINQQLNFSLSCTANSAGRKFFEQTRIINYRSRFFTLESQTSRDGVAAFKLEIDNFIDI